MFNTRNTFSYKFVSFYLTFKLVCNFWSCQFIPWLWGLYSSQKLFETIEIGQLHNKWNVKSKKNLYRHFQKHDRKTHRLWFLWPPALTKVPPEVAGKCGCVGGCSFFGANCNGRNFFKPSRVDVDERCNVAIPTVKDRREKPAYGQSILYDNVLVTADCKWFR